MGEIIYLEDFDKSFKPDTNEAVVSDGAVALDTEAIEEVLETCDCNPKPPSIDELLGMHWARWTSPLDAGITLKSITVFMQEEKALYELITIIVTPDMVKGVKEELETSTEYAGLSYREYLDITAGLVARDFNELGEKLDTNIYTGLTSNSTSEEDLETSNLYIAILAYSDANLFPFLNYIYTGVTEELERSIPTILRSLT